jgi:hypothetical protein
MAVSRLFDLYAVNINGILIDHISSCNYSRGMEPFLASAAGSVDPSFAAIKKIQPVIKFSTTCVAKAMALMGISHSNITTLTLYFQQRAQGGTYMTGDNHVIMQATSGLVVPQSLSAKHDAPAELSFEVYPLSTDGVNAPLSITKNSALAGSPVVDEVFFCGPANINGALVDGNQDVNIEFGVTHKIAGDQVYNTFGCITKREPKVTITSLDMDLMADLGGVAGIAQGTTDSVFYLRKAANGGTFVANATAEHISLSVAAGHIGVSEGGGSEGEAQATIEIIPVSDGTNDVLVLNAATAIS